MVEKEKIKDYRGVVVGTIETDTNNGNKVLRNAHSVIVGRYNAADNITRDARGRIAYRGDQLVLLLKDN